MNIFDIGQRIFSCNFYVRMINLLLKMMIACIRTKDLGLLNKLLCAVVTQQHTVAFLKTRIGRIAFSLVSFNLKILEILKMFFPFPF